MAAMDENPKTSTDNGDWSVNRKFVLNRLVDLSADVKELWIKLGFIESELAIKIGNFALAIKDLEMAVREQRIKASWRHMLVATLPGLVIAIGTLVYVIIQIKAT